eukprot:17281-Heterococcus_DN1.PRE.1
MACKLHARASANIGCLVSLKLLARLGIGGPGMLGAGGLAQAQLPLPPPLRPLGGEPRVLCCQCVLRMIAHVVIHSSRHTIATCTLYIFGQYVRSRMIQLREATVICYRSL